MTSSLGFSHGSLRLNRTTTFLFKSFTRKTTILILLVTIVGLSIGGYRVFDWYLKRYVENGTGLGAKAVEEAPKAQNDEVPQSVHYTPLIEASPPTSPLIGDRKNPRSRLNIQQIQWSNLDLMNLEMSRLGLRQGILSIGLVDGNMSSIVKTFGGSITIGFQNPVAKFDSREMYEEHWNHGVEVADVLSAAAPGSYIRSFQGFDGPDGNDFDSRAAIRKACGEGDLVINFSASNEGIPLQYTYPGLQNELAEHGCILIEASGNAGRHPKVSMSWDRDFITVGALNLAGKEPNFSTPGVVYAPGVAWLLSNYRGEVHLTHGTSYAAPVVTAIAKNIYTILLQSSDFNSTSLPEHAFVVQKVLRESSRSDARGRKNVDGYRAMLLAQHVRRNGILSYIHLANESSRTYVQQAMAAQRRAMPINRCYSIPASTNCPAKIACYSQKRMYLSATEEPSPVDLEDLRATASNSNEPALAYEWAVKLSPDAADPLVTQSFLNFEETLRWSNDIPKKQ
jgi:hypothetical protein